MEAVGPYSYWQQTLKVNVSWSADTEYVTYISYSNYVFQYDTSGPGLDPYVNIFYQLNAAYLRITSLAQTAALYSGVYSVLSAQSIPLPANCSGVSSSDLTLNTDQVVLCKLALRNAAPYSTVWKQVYQISGGDTSFFLRSTPSVFPALYAALLKPYPGTTMSSIRALSINKFNLLLGDVGLAIDAILGAGQTATLDGVIPVAAGAACARDPVASGGAKDSNFYSSIASLSGSDRYKYYMRIVECHKTSLADLTYKATFSNVVKGYIAAVTAGASSLYGTPALNYGDSLDKKLIDYFYNVITTADTYSLTFSNPTDDAGHETGRALWLKQANLFQAHGASYSSDPALFAADFGTLANDIFTAIGVAPAPTDPLKLLSLVVAYASSMPTIEQTVLFSPIWSRYMDDYKLYSGIDVMRLSNITDYDLILFQFGGDVFTASRGNSTVVSFLDTSDYTRLKSISTTPLPIPDRFTAANGFALELFNYQKLYALANGLPAAAFGVNTDVTTNVLAKNFNYQYYPPSVTFNLKVLRNLFMPPGVTVGTYESGYGGIYVNSTIIQNVFAATSAASLPIFQASSAFIGIYKTVAASDPSGQALTLFLVDLNAACGTAFTVSTDPDVLAGYAQGIVAQYFVLNDASLAVACGYVLGNASATYFTQFATAQGSLAAIFPTVVATWNAYGVDVSTLGPEGYAVSGFKTPTHRKLFYILFLTDYLQKNMFALVGCGLDCFNIGDGLILRKTADQLIGGYNSPLLKTLTGNPAVTGFLFDRTETQSNTTSALNTYSRGTVDILNVNKYYKYKGSTTLPLSYMPGLVNKPALRTIDGYEFTQFPPASSTNILVDVTKPRFTSYNVFLEPAFRQFTVYYKFDKDVKGIKLNIFEVEAQDLNKTSGNFGNNVYYGTSVDGVQPVSGQKGFLAYVSRPYYLYGEDFIYQLYPNFKAHTSKDKYDSQLGIEPITGATLYGVLNFMGSLGIDKMNVNSAKVGFGVKINSTYTTDLSVSGVKEVPFPYYWYTQSAILTDSQASDFKAQVYGASQGSYAALIVGPVVGILLIIAGVILLVLHNKEQGLGKTESTAEMLRAPAYAPEVANPVYGK